MLTAILKVLIFIERKINIPNGTPIILPIESLFSSVTSISAFIFQINDIEITKERIIFICMASCGENNKSRKGVAIMENPKPVLVCKIEATKIIRMKIIIVSKKILLFSLSGES